MLIAMLTEIKKKYIYNIYIYIYIYIDDLYHIVKIVYIVCACTYLPNIHAPLIY